jgi:hypothetical protein
MSEPNYLINAVLNWIKSNPLFAGIAALVLAVLLVWFKDSIGGQFERFNQWRFDKAVAAKQAEIDKISQENKRLLEEAKRAFALGEAKELERDAAYAELERYGVKAREAVAAQQKAQAEYEADKNRINADIPMFEQCRMLCSERAEVGYPCRPSVDLYCARYAGR